ncbi:unnamed protein product [Penicillium olsonii]|nr:unnamed protein product [Penicillium olsonii]
MSGQPTIQPTEPTREDPTETEETWDADDEQSDDEGSFDPFENFSSILIDLPEPKWFFNFHVSRDSQPTLGTDGMSDGWINKPYFLWELCAILAAAGTDKEWTEKFEQWKPTWLLAREQMRTYGCSHFSSEFPLAPIGLALIRFPEDGREFEIDQGDDLGDFEDGSDVWALWRYLVEMPVGKDNMFEVTLVEEV